MAAPWLEIKDLSKSYGGVRALHRVSLDVAAGEVHALCGENGAGKSTLIKILTGVVAPDSGEVTIAGAALRLGSVAEAEAAGIAVMHQESTAFPDLNAVDNLFVGRELTRWGGWRLDHAAMRQQARQLFERLGEPLPLDIPIGRLPLAQRQLVALARALLRDCRLVIMDEPTASLSSRESAALLKIVGQLRAAGVGVLYVSHRLDEVFQIADRITVLRDGERVVTARAAELDARRLIHAMVGRDVEVVSQRRPRTLGPVKLEVRRLTRRGVFADISFTVRGGEIVGLAGLVGAGRSEIARALFGVDAYESGSVLVNGRPLRKRSVPAAIAAGLALVPEDRQHEGLLLPLSVRDNLSLPQLRRLAPRGLIRWADEERLAARVIDELAIKVDHPLVPASSLSGGNQQRVVLGRWLAASPAILLFDEPTRGVDVGAKAQIHERIGQLADAGLAIVVISSDMPELLALCDRLVAIRRGRVAGELAAELATPAQVLALTLPDVDEEREP